MYIFQKILLFLLLCLCGSLYAMETEPATGSDYQLGVGDKVRIQIYNEDDLNLETRVSDTGIISYPFLGNIEVLGLTPKQLEQKITSKLKGDYLVNPKVSVDIVEYRQFYVNGEVRSPGGYPFEPGITIRKAISIAGGFKERASQEKIFIIREDSSSTDPFKVSLDEKVRPGDIITVEESFF